MATTRSLSSATLTAAPTVTPAHGARHRLRAVDRDEVVDVADFLPPGATWLPAPQHTLPTLPGQPPMIGYLVLVPADQQPPFLPVAVPDRTDTLIGRGTDAGQGGDPLVRIDSVQRTAEVDGRELDLTYLEFELLAHLVAHPHRVHSRDQRWSPRCGGTATSVTAAPSTSTSPGCAASWASSTARRSRPCAGSATSTPHRPAVDHLLTRRGSAAHRC